MDRDRGCARCYSRCFRSTTSSRRRRRCAPHATRWCHASRSWARSAHGEIVCVNCHTGPFGGTTVRARLSARRPCCPLRLSHLAGGYQDPVETRSPGRRADGRRDMPPVSRSQPQGDIRLPHQDPARRARRAQRVVRLVPRAHRAPAANEEPAAHAHVAVLHLSRSGQGREGARQCGVCHPKTYDLEPGSHRTRIWKFRHGVWPPRTWPSATYATEAVLRSTAMA